MSELHIRCRIPEDKYPVLEVKRTHMYRVCIRTRILCPECFGNGAVDLYCCNTCDGSGRIEAWIPRAKWHALKTADHIMEHETQENLLNKRYGTKRPDSVRDYWLEMTPMIEDRR